MIGSRQGAGLGMKALESLDDVDVIIHVLRGFDNENVTHYREAVNPLEDMKIIDNEMLMHV